MKKFIYITFLLALLTVLGNAQESFTPNYTLSFVPQYLFKNGLRMDLELKLKKENQWLQIAPQVYYHEAIDDYWYDYSFEKLGGVGLDLHHKIYLSTNKIAHGPYLSYGMVYQHFAVRHNDYIWVPYEESGLTYYDYTSKTLTGTIHKGGINLLFGYQVHPFDRLLLDVYLGMGIRKSFPSESMEDRFNSSIIDYNYSGTLLVFGVRFGALL
jgi:hypothetical protein